MHQDPVSNPLPDAAPRDHTVTPLGAVLAVTFFGSLGTGVFWYGLSFIAKHTYGFSQTRNLVLYAILGILYAIGAFRAGALTRRVGPFLTPRGLLVVAFGGQAAACAVPALVEGEVVLWLAAIVVTMLASIMWPIAESYLTAGRHGPEMRTAIGWFNLTWMPAMALPMFLMAPLLERHGAWALAGFGAACVPAIAALRWFSPRPAPHEEEVAAGHVPAAYPFLLRSFRILLPVSYVLQAALTPVLPYRYEALGVAVHWETPFTATWMVVRVAAMIVMWRLPFWHGRWGTLVLGAASMVLGFAIVVLAPTVPTMLAGFAVLGAGLGIVYYAALYYAMAVGRAEVDAGGTHEALIGAGYAIGPLSALAGAAIAGSAGIVGAVMLVVAAGVVPAARPYRRWRRLR